MSDSKQELKVGDETRLLMHRTVRDLSTEWTAETLPDAEFVTVTVTSADLLTDGRTRYTAVAPRLVQWIA